MIVYLLIPQSTNLSQEKASDNKQQWADNVAESELRHLRDILGKQNDDLTEDKEQSQCL